MFTYVWKYKVKQEYIRNFERAYGSQGEWVRLFHKADGYIKTELMRDRIQPHTYVTVDYWENYESYQTFKKKFSNEFQGLDTKFEDYSENEIHIGDFTLITN